MAKIKVCGYWSRGGSSEVTTIRLCDYCQRYAYAGRLHFVPTDSIEGTCESPHHGAMTIARMEAQIELEETSAQLRTAELRQAERSGAGYIELAALRRAEHADRQRVVARRDQLASLRTAIAGE